MPKIYDPDGNICDRRLKIYGHCTHFCFQGPYIFWKRTVNFLFCVLQNTTALEPVFFHPFVVRPENNLRDSDSDNSDYSSWNEDRVLDIEEVILEELL